jgi:hypothetical protein
MLVEAWQAVDAGEPVDFDVARASMSAAEHKVEAFSRHAASPIGPTISAQSREFSGDVLDRLEEGDTESAGEAFRAALEVGANLQGSKRMFGPGQGPPRAGLPPAEAGGLLAPWLRVAEENK